MAQVITIFQTQDPYVNDADLQFIASRKITLNANRELYNETLTALGLGEPGEQFCVVDRGDPTIYMVSNPQSKFWIDDSIVHDAEYGPVLIVCGFHDEVHAMKRFHAKQNKEMIAELIAELMTPLRVPCKYVTSKVSRASSQVKIWWRSRHVGDQGYLVLDKEAGPGSMESLTIEQGGVTGAFHENRSSTLVRNCYGIRFVLTAHHEGGGGAS